MALVLASLHFDLDALCQQVLGSTKIPTVEDLIYQLLWLSSSVTTTAPIIIDNSTMVTQTSDHGHNGGQSNQPSRTYCHKPRHSWDKGFTLTVILLD